ncbi:MAG: metallophosphoesterase, partial [Bacteroidia bacterium]|nr:metallophosphoesterase [Bacteroidia bacterium]
MKPLNILVLVLFTIQVFFAPGASSVQVAESVYDGPYFFIENNKLTALLIRNGFVRKMDVSPENFNILRKRYDLRFGYNDLWEKYHKEETDNFSFSTDGNIAIMADLHGEYENYIRLLKKSGIIDRNLNWSYGKNHLVILGDIFDRGPMVTEILWHLFGLELQASAAGGEVHILLGNHEYMILTGNSQFINTKYMNAEQIIGKSYSSLFLSNSILGNW